MVSRSRSISTQVVVDACWRQRMMTNMFNSTRRGGASFSFSSRWYYECTTLVFCTWVRPLRALRQISNVWAALHNGLGSRPLSYRLVEGVCQHWTATWAPLHSAYFYFVRSRNITKSVQVSIQYIEKTKNGQFFGANLTPEAEILNFKKCSSYVLTA